MGRYGELDELRLLAGAVAREGPLGAAAPVARRDCRRRSHQRPARAVVLLESHPLRTREGGEEGAEGGGALRALEGVDALVVVADGGDAAGLGRRE